MSVEVRFTVAVALDVTEEIEGETVAAGWDREDKHRNAIEEEVKATLVAAADPGVVEVDGVEYEIDDWSVETA